MRKKKVEELRSSRRRRKLFHLSATTYSRNKMAPSLYSVAWRLWYLPGKAELQGTKPPAPRSSQPLPQSPFHHWMSFHQPWADNCQLTNHPLGILHQGQGRSQTDWSWGRRVPCWFLSSCPLIVPEKITHREWEDCLERLSKVEL